jgi:pyrimidine deaminase RibD-like protein
MPLDEIGRRYADSIYQRRLHEISGNEEQEINRLRNQHASRGSILSGSYIHDHFELLLKRIDILAQAKSDGLVKAYEKSGIPFDEAAFQDVKGDVVSFCHSQQHNLIGSMTQVVRQTLGQNIPAETFDSLSKQIVSRIDAMISRLVSDLAIKRDEKILDDRNTKQVYAADRKFARLAIEEARKSVPENDGRPHPWVGAVVVKDGKVLGTAHRGEVPGNHAEFVALERNLPDVAVASATVYTTLEPCTTRTPPKIPCVDRLIERRVARVVIGILDPDDRIRGKGQRKLSNAGIETTLFPHDLAMEVEELNREFTRFCQQQTLNLSLPAKTPTTNEDQSNWPDVILECQWPSLVHESKIPGSHVVRKRPWMLRYRGSGAVYNVCVHDIDFGEYKASFPFRVPTLTDTASVHSIICHKSDGLVIPAYDLESLIQNPPSGCDAQKYAVQTDGNEGEEIPLASFILEVEIPVTISYEDKNGNQFKIRYLLHYDTYMEKGEMMRMGKIEKVAPK